jgi:hypothetical protein
MDSFHQLIKPSNKHIIRNSAKLFDSSKFLTELELVVLLILLPLILNVFHSQWLFKNSKNHPTLV